ncbi:type VI secretion system baseplate subunit TssF [Rapidithrix thailandica]|uniref:Type VI secretion system baseplate subunit TssF n=1 Tax=Rapidithrix thailandica TaxID=413964 RepID=A0AAW9SH36_9BACT
MESKQKIKDRILRRAARIWGYSDSEIETNFDPIVAMLLEACGTELEKLYAEVDNSRTRVVERLIDIMSPASYSGAIPAHAIVHALPVENNTQLAFDDQFIIKKNIPNIYEPSNPITKDIYFGSTGEFTLSRANVAYLAFSNTIYRMSDSLYRELQFRSNKYIPKSVLWVGVRVFEDSQVLNKLMFYTDTRNNHQRDFYFHNLRQANIYINGQKIKFREGFNMVYPDVDIEAATIKNYDKINKVYADVNNFYREKFFYLEDEIDLNKLQPQTPQELKDTFGEDYIEDSTDLLWMKVEFPEAMVAEVLEEIHMGLNCFPVINKQLMTVSQNIDPFINYIPLKTNDFFLDIENITDSQSNQYHIKHFTKENLEEGDATLRNGGVARFGQRSAAEHIQHLLDLLKDEAASFSVIGGDFVDNQLKQLHQLIAALEQQANEKRLMKTDYPYVVLKAKISKEQIHNDFFSIKFWATVGEDANDIKSGMKLNTLQGAAFQDSTLFFVTPTVGGRAKLTHQDKIAAYRETLLTKGRIVTVADIKAFCFNHFKQTIKSVDVKKGTEKDKSLKQGFVRTIEIILERNTELNPQISDNEWEYLRDSFLHKLKKVSSNVYPYKIKEKGEISL